jgi:hypothetical protein
MLNDFIERLPQPVCLIAHNGLKFDFPIVQAELYRIGKVRTLKHIMDIWTMAFWFVTLLVLWVDTNIAASILRVEVSVVSSGQCTNIFFKVCSFKMQSVLKLAWSKEGVVTREHAAQAS